MDIDIRTAYADGLKAGWLKPDPAQAPAIEALARLEEEIEAKGFFKRRKAIKGLYLYGPPGRGKSLLMNLFEAHLDEPRKERAHFHAFMARVHDLIRQWREGDARARRKVLGQAKGDDPIRPTAELIASEARVLCFDELQVTDIADAMILGRLFEHLFELKVALVLTSNRAPEALYENGINRQLFLPFIDLIRDHCEVVELTGERDWRVDRLVESRLWLAPINEAERTEFETLWADLKGGESEAPIKLTVSSRKVGFQRTAGSLLRATFAELCARPLGARDYLTVAERFHTVMIQDVPVLDVTRKEEARRFVTLIDALYEARTRLVVLAEAPPEALYVEGIGAFEFERTVSRLNQMTRADWLARPETD